MDRYEEFSQRRLFLLRSLLQFAINNLYAPSDANTSTFSSDMVAVSRAQVNESCDMTRGYTTPLQVQRIGDTGKERLIIVYTI